jgi:prevent-host-death family protein
MHAINITEAKMRLSEVVNQVLAGEDVIIERMGKPVVRISRYEPSQERARLGLMAGQAHIPDDFDSWPLEEALALGIIDNNKNE